MPKIPSDYDTTRILDMLTQKVNDLADHGDGNLPILWFVKKAEIQAKDYIDPHALIGVANSLNLRQKTPKWNDKIYLPLYYAQNEDYYFLAYNQYRDLRPCELIAHADNLKKVVATSLLTPDDVHCCHQMNEDEPLYRHENISPQEYIVI